ncbi:capsular polysaccharide biosynthesis protein [Lutimaribacter marinistellae]|uniref:Capsular polysaccharide biosynthesis protein n=1 Tax=Lutimaribacter marinistellae TaxID=1820329 RepID=A0ABV7TK91_9RHOB
MRSVPQGSAEGNRSRLFVYNGGFLTQKRVRRILSLSGYDIRLGLPGPGDAVAIWGASPTASRGRAIAAKYDVPVITVEDAFLRSLHPGRAGEPPLGLSIDHAGVHFDARHPSDLETLLATHPLDDTALLDAARAAMARIAELELSKYSGFDPSALAPDPGYVLVIDQTRGDASVTASNGDDALFREMLVFAQEENPGARVIIKSHPETLKGYRAGYFGPEHTNDRIALLTENVSPRALLEGAVGVYTLSSQMGFEAILAGHKPRVFGQPFYAGWGLTQDQNPVPRRERRLTRAQLVAAALIIYPRWYDPYRDRLCELEQVLDTLESQVRAWRQDHAGWTASGMRLWKRNHLRNFFGGHGKLSFVPDKPQDDARPHMCWANRAPPDTSVTRVEDGFLRSRGLGAELVPPLSLVTDELGIYYDPTRPSRLEQLIATRETLRPDQERRAERLIAKIVDLGMSKYNLGGEQPNLPAGYRVLVPGQVEDDASILKGAGDVCDNLALLRAVRTAHPEAVIVYKPHPDVEAGLRDGKIEAEGLADVVAKHSDPVGLLAQVDELWTMTSLMGFEALLRGVKVTTLGAPFYAGWGLTDDRGPVPARRGARPSLAGLAHATLIDYPRYRDPVTGLPCPAEVAIDRLSRGEIPHPGLANRTVSKLQGLLATYAHIWR